MTLTEDVRPTFLSFNMGEGFRHKANEPHLSPINKGTMWQLKENRKWDFTCHDWSAAVHECEALRSPGDTEAVSTRGCCSLTATPFTAVRAGLTSSFSPDGKSAKSCSTTVVWLKCWFEVVLSPSSYRVRWSSGHSGHSEAAGDQRNHPDVLWACYSNTMWLKSKLKHSVRLETHGQALKGTVHTKIWLLPVSSSL